MKRILGVTGIRSEYDILFSVYKAITARKDLQLSLVVTGAHLSKAYGLTIEEIKKDGFEIAETVESLINSDRDAARIKGAGVQLYGLAQAVDRIRPDMLLAFGDREESITTALVGTYLNIPVAHISGGDRVVGNIDDSVRHAVTKLSHLHFATSEDSRQRILKLGEEPFRVFNTGNPGLDRLASVPEIPRKKLFEGFGFNAQDSELPLLVLIQHPLSSEIPEAYVQMKSTLEAVVSTGFPTIVSYPNSDAGSHEMIRALKEYEGNAKIKIHRNIPRLEFVNALRQAACLVGNSSLGLLEAPFLKLPVVNVGNRQKERMNAGNVEFVSHDVQKISQAIQKAALDKNYRAQIARLENPFGDGHAGEKIAKILAETEIDRKLLLKDITF